LLLIIGIERIMFSQMIWDLLMRV